MSNLLEETKEALHFLGLTLDDVRWVGCRDFKISMEQFIELADQEYDSGFGGQEVAKDLLVVGDNWWLERHEYDGSEWWEIKRLPQEPEETREIERLISQNCMWSSLEEINEPDVTDTRD